MKREVITLESLRLLQCFYCGLLKNVGHPLWIFITSFEIAFNKSEVFKKSTLKNFAKLTGKHLSRELLLK